MELRWVLIGFGTLLIVGIYVWGRWLGRPGSAGTEARERAEPRLAPENDSDSGQTDLPQHEHDAPPQATVVTRKPSPRAPEKVVALRIIPRGEQMPTGEETVLALRKHGLEHGLYGIFHKVRDGDVHNPEFSVASLTKPGSFDLTKLSDGTISGLSIFLALPGKGDPVARFDSMLEMARVLAHELDAEILDEKGSSWSVQRERYVREEMIEYRHHLSNG
jgi:cell division protein ZipA